MLRVAVIAVASLASTALPGADTYARAALYAIDMPRFQSFMRQDGEIEFEPPGVRVVGGGEPPHPNGMAELVLYATRNARRAFELSLQDGISARCAHSISTAEAAVRTYVKALHDLEQRLLTEMHTGDTGNTSRASVASSGNMDRLEWILKLAGEIALEAKDKRSGDTDDVFNPDPLPLPPPREWRDVAKLLADVDASGSQTTVGLENASNSSNLRICLQAIANATTSARGSAGVDARADQKRRAQARSGSGSGRDSVMDPDIVLRTRGRMPRVGFGLGDPFTIASVPGGRAQTGSVLKSNHENVLLERAAILSAVTDAVLAGVRHFDSAEIFPGADNAIGDMLWAARAATDDTPPKPPARAGKAAGATFAAACDRARRQLSPLRLNRTDFFLTTKLSQDASHSVPADSTWKTHRMSATIKAVRKQLEVMRTDYIDVYYLHAPVTFVPETAFPPGVDGNKAVQEQVWRELEFLHVGELGSMGNPSGPLRALGVVNFDRDDMAALMDYARVRPAVLQNKLDVLHASGGGLMPPTMGMEKLENAVQRLRSRPTLRQLQAEFERRHQMLRFCRQNGVAFVAFSTLNGYPYEISALADPHLAQIAREHTQPLRFELKASHVALRYALQLGAAVVPKAAVPAHIHANAPEKLLSFTLSKEEMGLIGGLAWASAIPGLMPTDVDDVHGFVSRATVSKPVDEEGEGKGSQRAQNPEFVSNSADAIDGNGKNSSSSVVDRTGRDEL